MYDVISDALQFRGPLFGILLVAPQIYPLIILSLLLHLLRKNERALKEAMWLWSVIFVIGSAWTALFIYAVNSG